MKLRFTFTVAIFLLTAGLTYAQSDAPYRGGSGDGYAMAEILVNTSPTAVDKELSRLVQAYPNPLKKDQELSISIRSTTIDRIRLRSSTGAILYDYENRADEGSIIRVPTEGWQPGIYLLELSNRQSSITKKIILL